MDHRFEIRVASGSVTRSICDIWQVPLAENGEICNLLNIHTQWKNQGLSVCPSKRGLIATGEKQDKTATEGASPPTSQVQSQKRVDRSHRSQSSAGRALTRYLDDGKIKLENSAAELAPRAGALGRKNFLFAGSDSGGERALCLHLLLGTAKLNGLDPELYLRKVLEPVADHPINRISELLPWHLARFLTDLAVP